MLLPGLIVVSKSASRSPVQPAPPVQSALPVPLVIVLIQKRLLHLMVEVYLDKGSTVPVLFQKVSA